MKILYWNFHEMKKAFRHSNKDYDILDIYPVLN